MIRTLFAACVGMAVSAAYINSVAEKCSPAVSCSQARYAPFFLVIAQWGCHPKQYCTACTACGDIFVCESQPHPSLKPTTMSSFGKDNTWLHHGVHTNEVRYAAPLATYAKKEGLLSTSGASSASGAAPLGVASPMPNFFLVSSF
jgi:hypothetical protein